MDVYCETYKKLYKNCKEENIKIKVKTDQVKYVPDCPYACERLRGIMNRACSGRYIK